MTNMVGEFGELQGIMGRYYALADHEPAEVAQALEEHYLPKQSGGITPKTRTGQIVALAEKLDTLTGIFSAGLIPDRRQRSLCVTPCGDRPFKDHH